MADLILVDLLWEMPSVLLPESKVGEVEKLEGGMHNLQVSGDILQVCSSAGFRKERERNRERPNFPLSFSEGQPRSLQNKRRGWKYGLAWIMLRAACIITMEWMNMCRIIPHVLLQKGTESQLIVKLVPLSESILTHDRIRLSV